MISMYSPTSTRVRVSVGRNRWLDHIPDLIPEVGERCPDGDPPGDRETEPARSHIQQDDPQKERGERPHEQREPERSDIELGAAPPCRKQPQEDPEEYRDELGREHQPDRVDQSLPQEIGDRLVLEGVGDPQVAARQRTEVGEELGVERVPPVEIEELRLVQPEALPQRLDRLLGEPGVARPGAGRVAGEHPEEKEVEDDDHEHGDDRPSNLLEDVATAAHQGYTTWIVGSSGRLFPGG